MKIIFKINYKSIWGQMLCICGGHELFGDWDPEKGQPMLYLGNDDWVLEMEVPQGLAFSYKYFVREANGYILWEGGQKRQLTNSDFEIMAIRDRWHPEHDPSRVMHSKVFTEVIMKPERLFTQTVKTKSSSIIRFCMRAPRVGIGFGLAIIGDGKSLGNWKKPILMGNKNYPVWQVDFDVSIQKFPLEYKYVIVDLATNLISDWETGHNRVLNEENTVVSDSLFVVNDENFNYPPNNWKAAGVAVPVFSLRSNESFGVGEFNDIRKLVDWCVKTGMKMIQILPINETVATHSWLDSYPYKSISVMALHPMFLHLPAMGKINNKTLQEEFDSIGNELNGLQQVDYVAVTRAKARYFKIIFDQNWEKVKKSTAYQLFFAENKEWLLPYAAFCRLRDLYKTSDFRQWEGFAVFDPTKIEDYCDPRQSYHEHIAVHYFQQFHLDLQLKEAVAYAHKHGVCLKGDIPIGISPNSIEAWTEPHLFNLNAQAGAPPDDFAFMGQNWGFPTYNWDEMARDDFAWWRKRLNAMEKYFDAYRIDHILGFFRIWEIPMDAVQGLLGYFKPGLPMNAGEIEDWGLWFDTERFTKPYIRGHFLYDFFGDYTDEVRLKYLNETDFGVFELKEVFNTQRKIYDYFSPDQTKTELDMKGITIRDGLLGLLNEVLFIKDPYATQSAYHPRIALHYTYSYRDLDEQKKDRLNELYIHFFYKRHEEFWKWHAMAKLPSIVASSNMLVCGEDLGMVPDTVPEVMHALDILSLEIQRMPKNPRIEFGHPSDAPYLSVCTTSTHDMSTIRGWWEEDRERTQRFYRHTLGHNDMAPYYAEPWVCHEIINQHLHSVAMWTIFPIQDLLALDGNLRWDETEKEQINVPANPENKWRYRMVISLEELIEADDYNSMLKGMVHIAGRDTDY
ncbi:MAG: 4-alpha-glucanotransferase [Bacteroidales bacterium]|nr:4-alpha-glucanotransferase [Bacteroidales bacterium]